MMMMMILSCFHFPTGLKKKRKKRIRTPARKPAIFNHRQSVSVFRFVQDLEREGTLTSEALEMDLGDVLLLLLVTAAL